MLSQFYHITLDALINAEVQAVLKEYFICEGQSAQERHLVKLYSNLSDFSKGRLIERAEELARLDIHKRNQILQASW